MQFSKKTSFLIFFLLVSSMSVFAQKTSTEIDSSYNSQPKEIERSNCNYNTPSVKHFKEKLNEHGYNLPINYNIDQATRDAIIHFQKKNGLPVGQIDYQILKKLGIKY